MEIKGIGVVLVGGFFWFEGFLFIDFFGNRVVE